MNGRMLVVSWTLFPWPTGSAVIVNNLASMFKSEDLLLVGEKCDFATDDKWPDTYPEIKYLDSSMGISVLGYGKRYIKWLFINRITNKIHDIINENQIDRLLCIYPNDYYLYAAYKASVRAKIPFYVWFHNTYLENMTGIRQLLAHWIQGRILKYSSLNLAISEGLREFYGESYPQFRFKTLNHGFKLPSRLPKHNSSRKRPRFSFVYTGNLNESCRDASIRLLKAILKDERNTLHIYSGTPMTVFEKFKISSRNSFHHGFVSLEELSKVLGNYDVMLLPHGFEGGRSQVEYDTIFPTRTIPLLVSGKPILAHTPPQAFLTRFLKQHDCALIVDEKSEESIQLAIEKIKKDKALVSKIVGNAFKASKYFDVRNVYRSLIELLDEAVGDRQHNHS